MLHAGDIGVVAKLKHTHTNDTLCDPERAIALRKIAFPKPDISVAIRGESRNDEDKLGEVLPKISEEDPSFVAEFNSELHQTIARGLGELHLEVQFERMARKYGVKVDTEQPGIAYRLRPLARGQGYEFINSIKGGVIPTKYVPSVDKGVQEAAAHGILAGYPVVDFAAECYDGSYHSVDSSDIAFKIAGSQAFKTVAARCRPVLLEPVMEVSVTTPDEYMGDIMGDLTSRRGKVQGMDAQGGRTVIKAMVPEAELYKYAAALRSMTQGRGHHTRDYSHYEEVPRELATKIIEEAKKAKAESA